MQKDPCLGVTEEHAPNYGGTCWNAWGSAEDVKSWAADNCGANSCTWPQINSKVSFHLKFLRMTVNRNAFRTRTTTQQISPTYSKTTKNGRPTISTRTSDQISLIRPNSRNVIRMVNPFSSHMKNGLELKWLAATSKFSCKVNTSTMQDMMTERPKVSSDSKTGRLHVYSYKILWWQKRGLWRSEFHSRGWFKQMLLRSWGIEPVDRNQ